MALGVVVPLALAVDAMHEDHEARQRVAQAAHRLAIVLGAVDGATEFERERGGLVPQRHFLEGFDLGREVLELGGFHGFGLGLNADGFCCCDFCNSRSRLMEGRQRKFLLQVKYSA